MGILTAIIISRAGEPGVFGSLVLEPEPLEKKPEPEPRGKKDKAGAANELAGSSGVREDKNHEKNCTFVTLL